MNADGKIERLWWTSDKASVAQDLTSMAAALEQRLAEKRAMWAFWHRLTTGREPVSSAGFAMSRLGAYSLDDGDFEAPSINALAECIEALTAHVGKNRPWILFQTDGAGLKARVRAKQASKWVWRLFHRLGVYDTGRVAFATGLRLGVGPVKVVYDRFTQSIKVEFVHLDECLWDDVEVAYSRDGKPYQFLHRRFVDIEEPCDLYPKLADKIRAAPRASEGVMRLDGLQADRYVAIVDGFRRPSPGFEDGRHTLAIGDVLLDDEKWKKGIPFVFWGGVERLPGQFLTQGITELGSSMQQEVNRSSALINEAERLCAGPWVLADERANVQLERMTNLPGQKVIWNSDQAAQAPSIVTHRAVDPSIYAERQAWVDRIRRRFGVSEMMSAGTKPAGLQSGEALRTLADQSTARHVVLGQEHERAYVEVAELVLGLAEEHDVKVDLGERYGGRLSWKDLKLDAKPVALPLSSLPLQPEGQIQAADEWLQRGIIDREMYASIVNMPDSQRQRDLLTASRDNIEWMLDEIVEKGPDGYHQPEPYQDIALLIRMAQERLLHEVTLGTPEDHLFLICQLIDDAVALRDATTPQPAAQPAPAAGVAPGAPPPVAPMSAPPPQLAPVDPNQPFGQA